MSQGMQQTLKAGKGEEMNSPLEPLEKSVALLIVWFQLSETMLDF